MNSLDKRTGRIHAFQPLLLDLVVNFLCYTVGANHDHALFDLSELFFCLNYRNAFFFKITDHLFIVDDRAISVYFCAGLGQLVHPVYRTLYAKAKACAFCKQNFHLFLISAHAFLRMSSLCQVYADTNPAIQKVYFSISSSLLILSSLFPRRFPESGQQPLQLKDRRYPEALRRPPALTARSPASYPAYPVF